MGNSSWGKGFHTGREEGFSAGHTEGRTEGLIAGLIITVVGSVFTAVGGYVFGKNGGAKGLVEKIRGKHKGVIYDVIADGKDNSGLELLIGDSFKILKLDGDSVKIEKVGDANNPYFVSRQFLASISSFN
jgi:hypothetical protein